MKAGPLRAAYLFSYRSFSSMLRLVRKIQPISRRPLLSSDKRQRLQNTSRTVEGTNKQIDRKKGLRRILAHSHAQPRKLTSKEVRKNRYLARRDDFAADPSLASSPGTVASALVGSASAASHKYLITMPHPWQNQVIASRNAKFAML